MTNTERTVRFFLCIAIALVPIGFIAMMEGFGVHSSRSNTGWAIICSILLLGVIAYRVVVDVFSQGSAPRQGSKPKAGTVKQGPVRSMRARPSKRVTPDDCRQAGG